MANDHARIRRDIWADEDWRRLTSPAQWLYMHLLTSPTLTFAGTTDWRPARIAAITADLSAADVETFGDELTDAHFILPDVETEEVLIRSWVKHDGLLRSPNMTKALVKAHQRIASNVLRGVLTEQLRTLRDRGHEGCWDVVGTLLDMSAYTFEEGVELLSINPSGKGSDNPSGKGFENRPTLHTPNSILHTPSSSSPLPVPHQGDADVEMMTASRRKKSAS